MCSVESKVAGRWKTGKKCPNVFVCVAEICAIFFTLRSLWRIEIGLHAQDRHHYRFNNKRLIMLTIGGQMWSFKERENPLSPLESFASALQFWNLACKSEWCAIATWMTQFPTRSNSHICLWGWTCLDDSAHTSLSWSPITGAIYRSALRKNKLVLVSIHLLPRVISYST